MRYRIIAVGQLKRGFYAEGCEFYLSRLNRLAPAEMLEIKDGKEPDVQRRTRGESDDLLQRSDGKVVVLDESGKSFGSKQLAGFIDDWETQSVSRVSLLLGGADGHSTQLRDRAEAVWRLSDLTLPHELARLVLLEQLYRAETIRAGHPYHRA